MRYHLKGKYHSGRAVEVRMLAASECDEVLEQSAKVVGADATMIQLQRRMFTAGVKNFIVAYTEPSEAITKETTWKKPGPFELDEKFDSLFTAKDIKILEKVYQEIHHVSQEEVDAIAGKELPAFAG